MKVNEDFFKENVRLNIFSLGRILYGVVSHSDNGLISQELGIVDNKGQVIDFFFN